MRWPLPVRSLEERRGERERTGHPGRIIDRRRAELDRVHVLRAGHRHDAGGRLDDMIVSGLLAARPVLAECRKRRIDQPRIDLGEILVAEPERLKGPGAIVLDEHVGRRDQLFQNLAAALGLQVERDGALVRSLRQEAGAHLAIVQFLVGAGRAALIRVVRIINLDDIGTEHGELIGGERPRQHVRHVDHANSLERTHRALPFALLVLACHVLPPV